MSRHIRNSILIAILLCVSGFFSFSFATAYNKHPKLVVVIVIDQFRGDYLDRGHDSFGLGGFRLLTDQGAWFTNCNYEYANTRTAPGHATLLTGAYSSGHGIFNNEFWNLSLKKMVTSVEDGNTQLVGTADKEVGASPHNLLTDTLGDELRLATDGKSRVFAIALKDRASVLPGGFSGTAFWTDHGTGAWITSTYYMRDLPEWVKKFNASGAADRYWNREWKVGDKVLAKTEKPEDFPTHGFYDVVGATPFANDYEFDFARELIKQERLGEGPTTDLLIVSLSANDILTHKVGPNSDESHAMVQAIDGSLANFFGFLGQQIGMDNVWIALSADHGVAPAPSYAPDLKIPAAYLGQGDLMKTLNKQLNAKLNPGKSEAVFVPAIDWPLIFLNSEAFTAAKVSETDAERMVGDFFKPYGIRGYFTREQLAHWNVPPNDYGRRYLNSLSPEASWIVYAETAPFILGGTSGTDHATAFNYDRHVPVAFFGSPFQPGEYRGECQTVDLAVTLANLLGINSPAAAVGHVLTPALRREKATGN